MGLIGAGAIVRKADLVLGLTTAATMWFVTVMGLCFGGGQIGLGLAALALGFATLVGLRWIEKHCWQDRTALVTMVVVGNSLRQDEIITAFAGRKFDLQCTSVSYAENGMLREIHGEICWRSRRDNRQLPDLLDQVANVFCWRNWNGNSSSDTEIDANFLLKSRCSLV